MNNPSPSSQLFTDVPFWAQLATPQPGWVWLVGIGPGHVGLLTLQAIRALQNADQVFHDTLMDERLRQLAPNAVWTDVGKRGGAASPKQIEISEALVNAARQGGRVIRLKGGDPFIFGRGAEEVEAMSRAGVPVQVVPGVMVGVGGLAAADIPATHRIHNQAITFLTAHGPDGALSADLDWSALARLPALVVYMPMKHRQALAHQLIKQGAEPETPVVLVGCATTPKQWSHRISLDALAHDSLENMGPGPVILAIGHFAAFPETVSLIAPLFPSGET